MNQTKNQILQGEALLEKDKKILLGVLKPSEYIPNLKAALQYLFEERVHNVENRLAGLRKKYEVEFERESSECNSKLSEVIVMAKKLVGRDPVAISAKIEAILKKYDGTMPSDQEERNDDFYELLGHIDFFHKNVKQTNPHLKISK